jgi:purine-binding chemotaxis protein CheW
MRLRLGFDPARADASHTNIVATVAGEYFSLMVDQLVDVIEIPLAAIEQPTADSEDPSRDSVAAVYAAPSGLIYVLDVDQLVAGISDTGFERNMR